LLVALALVACQPSPQVVEVTRVVAETVVEPGEIREVTRVVTEVTESVVTATPEAVAAPSLTAPDPTTYVSMGTGDVVTMDPALAYDDASGGPLVQTYETLIWYNFTDGTSYVPALATEVPTADNGGISDDGMTYTFHIRDGVTFHNGATLEPSDVAYTFQRGLLQSDPGGPQWLLIQPIMGYDSGDITQEIAGGAYAADPDGLRANAPAEELLATCEKVQSAVVADDAAGTVTFHLARPWSPFLATLAQIWGSVLDKDWTIEQGDWDGSCDTWADFYAPGAANSHLTATINGTGPYMLDHWTPGEEVVLVANENYWRTPETPIWEGGPAGQPAIKTVIHRIGEEWGTRFAALQVGDASEVAVPQENIEQVDTLVGEICDWQTFECAPNPDNPDGPLRKWANLPSVQRNYDLFMNFNVVADSPYVGSGRLDGEGIPLDFFSDVNVRKAMATCFNYDVFNNDALRGQGLRSNGPIIQDMLGYNPDGPVYEYDPEACAGYLAEAWGGQLPETGFRFQIAFDTGSTTRQVAAEILQEELAAINELYQVEVVGLPWPSLLAAKTAGRLPMHVSGWIQDIHDPHNWTHPYTLGWHAGNMLPEEMQAKYQELVTAGVLAPTPEEREAIYFDLQQQWYEDIPTVITFQTTIDRYEQRWVEGWFYRVGQWTTYMPALSLRGE
jgi:peptide/nickel transport system substrate-binding protein